MKLICKYILIAFALHAFIGLPVQVNAQSAGVAKHRITTGPKGAVILFWGLGEEQRKVTNRFPAKGDVIEVYRAANAAGAFKKLASVSFPSSAKDMQQKIGEEALQVLLNHLKVSSAEAAYNVLVQSSVDTLGFLAFSLPVLEAMGMAYTDRTWKEGDAAVYRFDKTTNGSRQENVYTEAVTGRSTVYTGTYKLHRFAVSDSSASGVWTTSSAGLPLFAQVFRSNGDREGFTPTAGVSLVNTIKNELFVQYNEQVTPGTVHSYYVRPVDWAGNYGPASDTLNALSVNINKIASISGLKVTDSLDGLLLQWKPLPRQAIYSAIQVLKSRRTGGDYVVLDTIPALDAQYLDRQIIPHVNYYYKVRPLMYKLPGKEEVPAAEAMGLKSSGKNIPLPHAPLGVKVVSSPEGIRISWDPNPALDIFAYYVLRGTSLKTLEVISAPVRDTMYVDSLFAANDAGTLVYAVQAMSLSQSMSDTSEAASIAIRQPVVLPPPGGLQARRGDDGIYLQWDHSNISENGIEGYMIYRRKKGEQYFTMITPDMVAAPFYTDNIKETAAAYEYAVTTIDAWGNQSILSPTASISADNSASLVPPSTLNLRNLAAGVEISWPVPYDAGNQQVVIYKKRVDEKEFKKLSTIAITKNYTDKAVQKGILYEYAVSLTDNGTEGSRSNGSAIRR